MGGYEQPRQPDSEAERRRGAPQVPQPEVDPPLRDGSVGIFDRPAPTNSRFWVALAVIVILVLLAVLLVLFVF